MYESKSRSSCPEIIKVDSLVDILERRASKQGDEVSLNFLNRKGEIDNSLTYQELNIRSKTIANELNEKAITGNVVLLYPPGLDFVEAFFGSMFAQDVTAVPVYPPVTAKEKAKVETIIKDCGAKAILCPSSVAPLINAWGKTVKGFEEMSVLVTDKLPNNEGNWEKPEVNRDRIAFLQYTSGSTSDPKGVMVSHGNLLHNMEVIQHSFGTRDGELLVCGWLPVYHDMGLIGNVIHQIYIGRPCLLMSPMDFLMKPYLWLKVISDYKVTTSGAPNFAYELCAKKVTDEQLETLDLSHWKVAFNGAEPIRSSTLEKFANRFKSVGFDYDAFCPCYGLAEGTLMVTGSRKGEDVKSIKVKSEDVENHQFKIAETGKVSEFVGSGKITDFQDIKIVNEATKSPLNDGEIGQIWVKGESVAKGYYGNPDATDKAFNNWLETGQGPYLNTGDLGCIYDSEIYITGREKDLLIFNGVNHYPQDIEYTVERSNRIIRLGCVAAVSIDHRDESFLSIVAEINDKDCDLGEISTDVISEVQKNHKLKVASIHFIEKGNIPKTSSGKIQRQRAKQSLFNGELEPVFVYRVEALQELICVPNKEEVEA